MKKLSEIEYNALMTVICPKGESAKLARKSKVNADNFSRYKRTPCGELEMEFETWIKLYPHLKEHLPPDYLPSHRTKPVKYIYKEGMSDKQEAAVNTAKQDLEKDKQALEAVKNQLQQAENEYKSACERYKSEAQSKLNQANEKLSGLAKEKADIEKVIKDLQV